MTDPIGDKLDGGRSPEDAPVYLPAEAAHHLRLPKATVSYWTFGRKYKTRTGPGVFHPLIDVADPGSRLLSFRNLVELHVLSSIRRTHKVEVHSIRRAIKFLQERFGSEHPLLAREMFTDGKDLFIEHYANILNISRHGQLEMKAVLATYLGRIEQDPGGIPIRLFPFTRPRYADSPRLISIDPRIRFGSPCIVGSRIPTDIIADRYEAGDSIALLAEDYGRPVAEIEEVIRYEGRVAS